MSIGNLLPTVAVYCGSSDGKDEAYANAATEVGNLLAQEGIRLIYGGGQRGLMGIVADSVMAAGGVATGIIPEFMIEREWAHRGITELITVNTMSERKEQMLSLASGIITLPGGLGTLEELSEVVSWSQLLIHRKPIGILNTAGYYDAFLSFFQHMLDEGFIAGNAADLLLVEEQPEVLLKRMAEFLRNEEE